MKFFTMILIFLSVVLGLSTTSAVSVWIMLELNLMSFVLFISLSDYSFSKVQMVQYFLVQAMSSLLLIFLVMSVEFNVFGSLSMTWASVPLMVKMGLPPFHSWYVSFISTSSWDVLFLGSSVQKVLPFMLITQMWSLSVMWLSLMILVSTVGSVRQNWIKKFLAYSSLFSGCCILSVSPSFSLGFMYLVIYCFALAVLVYHFQGLCVSSLKSLMGSSPSLHVNLTVLTALFSLAGLPPFLGFLAKIWALAFIQSLSSLLVLVLLISSALVLFMYLQIGISYSVTTKGSVINFYTVDWAMTMLFAGLISGPALIMI